MINKKSYLYVYQLSPINECTIEEWSIVNQILYVLNDLLRIIIEINEISTYPSYLLIVSLDLVLVYINYI